MTSGLLLVVVHCFIDVLVVVVVIVVAFVSFINYDRSFDECFDLINPLDRICLNINFRNTPKRMQPNI
tara:strand:+ start:179 stop:382 length:204 start_codon:yes stop_codon:yes gene_type:complete